jgi:ATP-dependent Clp protease ATP-binding subunit ClpC
MKQVRASASATRNNQRSQGTEARINASHEGKEAVVTSQDFDTAGKLRDRELEIEKQLKEIAENKKQAAEQAKDVPVVNEEDIAQIVALGRIPVSKLTESESELLLQLEDTLHQRFDCQEEAVKAVSRAVRRARVGLKNPNRPIASFIFSGPTGVGKTELTKRSLPTCSVPKKQ